MYLSVPMLVLVTLEVRQLVDLQRLPFKQQLRAFLELLAVRL